MVSSREFDFAMETFGVNLVYPSGSSESLTAIGVIAMPRVGDLFQYPYGKGKRYRVKAIVYEADGDHSAMFVELEAA